MEQNTMIISFKRTQHFSKLNAINPFAYREKRKNLIKFFAILSVSWVLSGNLLEDNTKYLCCVHVAPSVDLHFSTHTTPGSSR